MLPGDGGPAGRQVPAGLASACMGQMGHEISTQFRFHGAPVNAPVKIYSIDNACHCNYRPPPVFF
jgi:hypothetical protein